jgi:hypothetical protein
LTSFVEYTQATTGPALFNVFREVVVDVWKERNQEARTSTVRITRRIADLRTKAAEFDEKSNLASPMVPSWNRIVSWLHEVDSFRKMAA